MDKPIQQKYKDIRQRSFETRYRLFIFNYILQDIDMEFGTEEILKFQITPPLVEIYTTIYYQYHFNDRIIDFVDGIDFPVKTKKSIEGIGKTHKELISKIQRQNNYYDVRENYFQIFEKEIFPENEFEQFFTKKIQGCRYCGITESQIEELINKGMIFNKYENRGFSLEVDRKNSNYEYSENNSVWSCFWCNNAKTDEFTFDEFRKVGDVIKQIWHERLKK